MINNTSQQKWERLSSKQLDNQFINEIIQGMNCSLFEAKAILDTVHKVYSDFFNYSESPLPGQAKFIVTSIENGPSKNLKDAIKIPVILTLDAGQEDLNARQFGNVVKLRRHRLQRIAQEAFMQGGLLTVEDIANRIFNCGERTLVRDIAYLKNKGIVLPLRSTIKDMGRSLSHRSIIVKQWLSGKEYSEIALATKHSIASVQNYVGKFKQVVALALDNYEVHTIAFLVKISQSLTKEYINLWHHFDKTEARENELKELLKKREP